MTFVRINIGYQASPSRAGVDQHYFDPLLVTRSFEPDVTSLLVAGRSLEALVSSSDQNLKYNFKL